MRIHTASEYLLAYALWVVTSALGIFVGFWAVRGALGSVAEFLTLGALRGTSAQRFQVLFTRNTVDQFSMVVLGVLAVIMVVAVEHYYRTGVDAGRLLRRFVNVTTIESGVLFVALVLQMILASVMGLFTIWSILVPCLLLAITVGLTWVCTRLPAEPCVA